MPQDPAPAPAQAVDSLAADTAAVDTTDAITQITQNLEETGRALREGRFEDVYARLSTAVIEFTLEGLIPALESSHAFAQAYKEAPTMSPDEVILINQSGRGDKDIFTIADAIGDPKWEEFIQKKADGYRAKGAK